MGWMCYFYPVTLTCKTAREAKSGLNGTASSMLPQNRRPAPLHSAATDPTRDWNWSDCMCTMHDKYIQA